MGMEERIMIFVDGSNFYFGLKEMFRRYPEIEKGLDYYKLAKILSHNRKLIRIYYYIGQVQEKDDPVRYRSQQNILHTSNKHNYALFGSESCYGAGQRLPKRALM